MSPGVAICRKLCDAAGFDPACVTDDLLAAALRRRRIALGGLADGDYVERLAGLPEEQREVLEELLVRESWFFRDRAPFALLREHVQSRWLDAAAPRTIRILSAPCAGGEEPYSVAMALIDMGLPAASVQIDALDLSHRALAHGEQACYQERVLREVPAELRDRFLEPLADGRRRVVQSLRACVHFQHANLLHLDRLPLAPVYEAVFMRNVLIYLTAQARDQIVAALRARLAPDGLLFVGHAEAALLENSGLRPAGAPGAFAFQHGAAPSRSAAARASRPANATPGARRALDRASQPRGARLADRTTAPKSTARTAEALDAVARQADAGDYPDALAGIERLLTANPAWVEARHLQGLILQALGRSDEARRAFERVLYLDPRHLPSLGHLEQLLVAQGDHSAAARLRARAERATEQP